jgi:nucleoside-diphosphate-sugar epimerase
MVEAIAITGANGWLGRQLVGAAAAAGIEARGIVRSDDAAGAVEAVGGRACVAPDLDPGELARVIKGCSALVHLAGISAERGGATYAAANVGGMRKAIAAAQWAGVTRIVYLSGLGVARYGVAPRATNGYFLAKLMAEVELFRSGLEALVLRPSYIIGPDDELIPALLAELSRGQVEIVGRGEYRLQPVGIRDACRAVLKGSVAKLPRHTVVDLVGPEALNYRAFVERVAQIAGQGERPGPLGFRDVSLAEADRQAAAGGYRGLLPDELDVLVCDETSDPRPLAGLIGNGLETLDEAIRFAVQGSQTRATATFRR